MNIALVAPFEEPVPPKKYGGTERVVYNLAQELVKMGHKVTLFASGDSHTNAKLVKCTPKAIRVLPEARIPGIRQGLNYRALSKALARINQMDFDIVHNHFGWPLLLFKDLIKYPIVTTLHGILSEPTERYMHKAFKNEDFISISNSQRRHGAHLHYVGTVYNGIRPERFSFGNNPQDYLVFLGRIHPNKGPEFAIEIAKKTKRQLIIAAKIDPLENHYFETEIKPLIDGKQIKFIGEINHWEKVRLLKNAWAMVSPIQWDEPFGITTIESLACGTPVITTKRGSMVEIVKDGKVGFLCSNLDEMIERVNDIGQIDRRDCRQHVEQYFTAAHMANGYLKCYQRILKSRKYLH